MKGCSKDKKDGKECGKDGKDSETSSFFYERDYSSKMINRSFFDIQYLLYENDFNAKQEENIHSIFIK